MQMGQLRMLPLYHLGRIIAPWKDLPLRCIFRSAYKKIYVKKQVFSSSCIHSFLFICLKKKFHSWPYCFTCFFIVILYNLPFFIWVIIWLMFGSHNRLETTRKEIDQPEHILKSSRYHFVWALVFVIITSLGNNWT